MQNSLRTDACAVVNGFTSHAYVVAGEEFMLRAIAAEFPGRAPSWEACKSALGDLKQITKSLCACSTIRPVLETVTADKVLNPEAATALVDSLSKALTESIPEELEKEGDLVQRVFSVTFTAAANSLETNPACVSHVDPILSKLANFLQTEKSRVVRTSLENQVKLLNAARDVHDLLTPLALDIAAAADEKLMVADSPLVGMCQTSALLSDLINLTSLTREPFGKLDAGIKRVVTVNGNRIVEQAKQNVVKTLDQPTASLACGSPLRSVVQGAKDAHWAHSLGKKKKVPFNDMLELARTTLYTIKAGTFAKEMNLVSTAIQEYEAQASRFGMPVDAEWLKIQQGLLEKGQVTKLEAVSLRMMEKNTRRPH